MAWRGSWLDTAVAAAAAAVGIIVLGPYFAWASPLYFRASVGLFAALVIVAGLVGRLLLSGINAGLAAMVVLLMAYYAAHPLGGIYAPSTGWLAIVLFILLPDRLKFSAYRCFLWVFVVTLIPGLVVWLLSAAGIDLSWSYLYAKRLDADFLLGSGGSYYRHYVGSVVRGNGLWTLSNGTTLFRLHGLYEEPGVVGTVSGLLLVAGRFRLRQRPENIVLLIAGLASFSLAFFAILYISLLLYRPRATIVVTIVAVALVRALDVSNSVPLLRLVLFDRLAVTNGSIAGDNRVTPLFAALFKQFWASDLGTKLFGSDQDITTVVNTGAFSYKVLIFQYGLVGFLGLLGLLCAALLSISRRRDALVLLGMLLMSIYQRPNVLSLPFLIILLGGAVYLERLHAVQRSAASPRGGATAPVPA